MESPLAWFRRGRDGERAAEARLRELGLEVLARNVRTKSGEIDLVAREGAALVFVEVKRRPTLAAAYLAVTAAKRRRMAAAALEAIRKLGLPPGLPLRFDLVLVGEGGPPRHVRGAFSPRSSSAD